VVEAKERHLGILEDMYAESDFYLGVGGSRRGARSRSMVGMMSIGAMMHGGMMLGMSLVGTLWLLLTIVVIAALVVILLQQTSKTP